MTPKDSPPNDWVVLYKCKDCGRTVPEHFRLKHRTIPLPNETEPRYVYKCPNCRGPLKKLKE